MTGRSSRVAIVAAATLLMASLVLTVSAQSSVMQQIRYGTVVHMEQTIVEDQPTGAGSRAGATVGAVAGYALAGRRDRWLGSLLGGVIGGAAGNAAERAAKKKKGWQLIVKLEDGEEIGIQVPGKRLKYGVGDRVRLMVGPNGKTSVSPA